jgi:hypothetical protein
VSKNFSICIPTVGRKTIAATLNSIFNTFSDEIEINIFLNGIDSKETLLEIYKYSEKTNVQFQSSDLKVPMWQSIQNALSMGTREYIWLLGDDDIVLPTTSNALNTITELDIVPELIVWNGFEIDHRNNRSALTSLPINLKSFDSPSLLLQHIYSDMSYLNNGRFAISKDLRNLMLQNNRGFEETFHDEYGALITSLFQLIRSKKIVHVASPDAPAVGLGLVVKSWSKNHSQAILGEIVMLSRLPDSSQPCKNALIHGNLLRMRKLSFLLVLRIINKNQIVFPQDLSIDQILKRRIDLVNRIPIKLIKSFSPIILNILNRSLGKKISNLINGRWRSVSQQE